MLFPQPGDDRLFRSGYLNVLGYAYQIFFVELTVRFREWAAAIILKQKHTKRAKQSRLYYMITISKFQATLA